MATNNTVDTLDGNFKRIYADRMEDLIPKHAKIFKSTKFRDNKKLGDTYEQPVILTNEHGVTYAAAGSGAFALETPIAMSMKNARVPSSQVLLRSRIDYESASKASRGGDSSFRRATELVVENMTGSIGHRLESDALYGGTGIGNTSSSVNASATSTVVTISAASWAIGMWAGAENAKLNFMDGASYVGGATYDATDAVFTITSVDADNKAITVSGSATGIASLDADIASTGTNIAIYWYGSYGNQMYGLDKIMTNTGTLFGISAATYGLWKSTQYNISGAISLLKLAKSTVNAIGKGGLDEDVVCWVAPQPWAVLNAELGAVQRYDSSYSAKKADWAFEKDAINIHTHSGKMHVMAHPMVKGGEGFIYPTKCLSRIGSSDVTFNNPGVGDRFFRELSDNAGFELRCYSDQAIFIDRPAVCTKLYGITY